MNNTNEMRWVEIDPNNLPENEVLAANFKKGTFGCKEKLIGFIGINKRSNEIICASDESELENVTHYIDIHKFDIQLIESE